jgi:hypothetical protein
MGHSGCKFSPQKKKVSPLTLLQNFLEWLKEQPEFFSPESLISELDPSTATTSYEDSKFGNTFALNTNLDNRVPWTEMTPGSQSPMSGPLSACTMPEDFTLYSEEYRQPHSEPSPQLPKIGRPRATLAYQTEGRSGEKTPAQAVSLPLFPKLPLEFQITARHS